MAADSLAAHRLVLTAAEWALLLSVSAMKGPPGFGPAMVDEPALTAARDTLAERRAVADSPEGMRDCVPVQSVAANLAILAVPDVMVQVEVAGPQFGLRAVYAVVGSVAASLFALDDGAVELSIFPAVSLGSELVRAVPSPAALSPLGARIVTALEGGRGELSVGRLPLAAMEVYTNPRQSRAAASMDAAAASPLTGLSAAEATLAAQLTAQSIGTLWCLVSGRDGDDVSVGQVVWLATHRGWIGLRPDPDGSDRQMVLVEPVAREALGEWVAPFFAEFLEAAND